MDLRIDDDAARRLRARRFGYRCGERETCAGGGGCENVAS